MTTAEYSGTVRPDGDEGGGEAGQFAKRGIIHAMETQQEEFLSFFTEWQKRQQELIMEVIKTSPWSQVVDGARESDPPEEARTVYSSQGSSRVLSHTGDGPVERSGSFDEREDQRFRQRSRYFETVERPTLTGDKSTTGISLPSLRRSFRGGFHFKDHPDGRHAISWWSWKISDISAKSIIGHPLFESCSACLILANAVHIAYTSDYSMNHINHEENTETKVIESLFCFAYTLELAVRLVAQGFRKYLCYRGTNFNKFDMLLVVVTWYDQIAALFHKSSANVSFLRVLRLFKMLRVLRMIRLLGIFRELRLILASVLGCARSLFWSGILLFLVAFMFGICFLQACTAYLEDGNVKHASRIDQYWGSFFKAVLSLYMAGTDGVSWSQIAEPLWEVGGTYYILFLLYVLFFDFVVVNTLTSLFVEATIENSNKDLQSHIQDELKRKEYYTSKLRAFYHSIDTNLSGEITYDEFLLSMNTPEMYAFAQCLEIDATDLDQFFSVLSDRGKRSVDLEAFVVGCIKLKGAARSTDLVDLLYHHERSTIELKQLAEDTKKQIAKLEKDIARIGSPMANLMISPCLISAKQQPPLSDDVGAKLTLDDEFGTVDTGPVPARNAVLVSI